jgi:hypothetical protein
MFIRRKNKKKKFVEGKTFNFFFLNIFSTYLLDI